jgi:hypothetical protein
MPVICPSSAPSRVLVDAAPIPRVLIAPGAVAIIPAIVFQGFITTESGDFITTESGDRIVWT